MRFVYLTLLVAGALNAASDPRAAVEKALPLLQRVGPPFWEGSGCISCHHQTLPAMAVSTARERGFAVNETAAKAAVKLTLDYLDGRRDHILQGIAPSGVQRAVSYVLFGLASEHVPGTEGTDVSARYLKLLQADDGQFAVGGVHRPPLEFSTITVTAMTMRVLNEYAPAGARTQYAESVRKASAWLEKAEPGVTEEYAFKILGLTWADAAPKVVAQTAAAITKQQRADGGWSQLPTLESDAYATGEVLVALQASGMKTTDPVYKRGVDFLLRTQAADGSWHVKSRVETVQVYFETGFPYGVDQFISTAGTSWATTALALTQPKLSAKR
jgi:hypothetical protein